MTALANAFRRAAGMPENNSITSKFEIEQANKKKAEELAERIEKLEEEQDIGRFGYGEYERVNEHGFKELGFWENNYWYPICAQCGCYAMPNRGQGMICDICDHQLMIEMSHDDFI